MVVAPIKTVNPEKVLILGAYGMLGSDLQKAFHGAELRGHELDITDEAAVMAEIRDLQPELVINAAGFTDVDGCEDQQEYALSVNGEGPGYIAAACKRAGARLIHYSTDYIFDGTSPEYIESDTPNPINQYGTSKLLGEQRIASLTDDYLIIRTSWLFGKNGKNFVDTIRGLSKEMDSVRVVDDQIGKPTYTRDLAWKTKEILGSAPGIYHITNDGLCSWFGFASAFIDNAVPCSSAEFPRKAKRPKYSVLTNTRTSPLRSWRDALNDYLSGE
ncbi:MAG: dTDP-4-dehydrorhamnose reductase [Methanocalculus sp. MSAO_Arc2]|uniref:dTDP-4-dehydrorhamnose reductase n=1 Tax=unclassified Methanocalculus TaxID=2631035 RepID=UPI000FF4C7F6|nr:dTDP-4-dehydrorhamnose reductase [Methanocalculus sp. AMF5]MCP1662285.1 dTDP-4-dehydrorhamnose reductase [Methanocalculus sp. AMF5]RQD80512.1 MAG: dTDP-4-dehydrorhamnose reductase [Methanocalculus sp. MSAO_Arc2]